ncbi:hypothetical protein UA08_08190 [Talaromyces atroroseus]|uniref:Zn(2)-C6 fungal-type domain-containing protein n=1 Tax=Talaromyces atroroseus TaxID=1441469 RepID=A0A225AQD2_TALAT|nr:hypothetical protein UA08_08190 [Talaromyces atroroseus]OKL56635.1 hypothetical protein UA08_08190 [Talaromyces atroroseus]
MYGIKVQGAYKGALDSLPRDLSKKESNPPPQRHRGLTICDACRQRRSRCFFDMANPVCGQCLLHGTNCTGRSRKSKVESMKRSRRARELEAEVQRMERLLRSAGIDPGESALDVHPVEEDEDLDSEIDGLECDGSARFNNSEHSSASPADRQSSESCTSPRSSCSGNTENFSHSLVLKSNRPEAEGVFFVNRVFPIINEESFMRMVEWQYTQQTCTDVARWASINALLALSFRYRDKRGSRSDKDTDRAWLYWKNAAAVYTELSLRPHGILGIQALLAMAIFARVNSHLMLAIPLITAAMKAAQALGLHRRNSRLDISPAEQETRRRVWWCIYIIDEGIGIKTGRGYLQHADDFDVELPSRDPDSPNEKGNAWDIDLFSSYCSHAVLRCNIYRGLYATQAFYKTFDELCETVDTLSAQLDQWKQGTPCLVYKLPDSKTLDSKQELEVTAHIAHRLGYLNSMTLIHRMPILYEIATRRHSHPDKDPLKYVSVTSRHHNLICLHAARDSLSLLDALPWKDTVYNGILFDFLFFAASILFSNIVQTPLMAELGPVDEILRLLNLTKNYFATLAPHHGQSKAVTFMATMTSVMERTAKKIIDKAMKEEKNNNNNNDNNTNTNTNTNVYTNNSTTRKEKQHQNIYTPPTQQASISPTTIEQTEEIRFPNTDLFPSAPFSGDSISDNFGQMGFGDTTDAFPQSASFPYMAPMPEQNMQMTEAYAHMYTDLYGYDMPSYLTAPVPNGMWGQAGMPDFAGSIPNEAKYDANMTSDVILEYMWNNNG